MQFIGQSSIPILNYNLKGQSNEIFDLQFFNHSNRPGPLTNGLKDFYFWFSFHRVIRIFLNLPGVSYCAESIMTPGSQLPFLKLLHRPLQGQCHKKNLDSNSIKELHFSLLKKVLG